MYPDGEGNDHPVQPTWERCIAFTEGTRGCMVLGLCVLLKSSRQGQGQGENSSRAGRIGTRRARQEIAEYLADAGHFVWTLDCDPVGPAEWRARMTHNAGVVDEDTLVDRRLDYVFGSAARRCTPPVPVLTPELRVLATRPEARCTVRLTGGDVLVCATPAVGDPHAAVLDACVDAVIRLSREGHESLTAEPGRAPGRPAGAAADGARG
ncbi:hypothetical protein SGLAM104S_05318 [Streptomyces glaucescens]